MAAPNPFDALVERALDAVRRLTEAAPIADAARATADDLTARWRRRPFTVGLTGEDLETRSMVLDLLCGGGVFEPGGRASGCPPIRLRRGAVIQVRARLADGRVETLSLPAGKPPPSDLIPFHARVESLRAEIAVRHKAAERAAAVVPKLVRVPPPVWALWLWLVRWFLLVSARRVIAASQRAQTDYAASRRALVAAEDQAPVEAERPPDPRPAFVARLRELCSGRIAVHEIMIEVDHGALPADVEVLETSAADEVDELVTLTGGPLPIAGTGRRLGTVAEMIASLGTLPRETRALRLARRASAVVAEQVARLADLVEHTEIDLRNRIARLDNLRIHDVPGFVQAQLARVAPQIDASVHAVIEHAGVHLSSELAALATIWSGYVEAAVTVDQLKAAATQIDEESLRATRRIGDETRLLITGGVGGCAHDLLRERFLAMHQPGLPEEHQQPLDGVPSIGELALLPALTDPVASRLAAELAGAGRWIAGLFRSLDARRSELRDKVERHAAHIRGLAEAELLDAEPRLRGALRETVSRELFTELERRGRWVAQELAREQRAVDAERAALRPLTEILELSRRDGQQLYGLLAEHEEAT